MIFLSKAFYDKDTGDFLGVELNKFGIDYSKRIYSKILDKCDIETYCKDNEKVGFTINNNLIESDSQNRFDLTKEQFNFLKKEISTCSKELDLTDLIMYLLELDGYILPNFFNTDRFTGSEVICAKDLKVSKSSFNIYGFLKVDNNCIHTELYDSKSLEPVDFFIGVPTSHILSFSNFKNLINIEKVITLNHIDTTVYKCRLPLIPYKSYIADSLVNWIVWAINIYRMYYDITQQFLDMYSVKEENKKLKYIYPPSSKIKKTNILVDDKDYAFNDYDKALELAKSNQSLLDYSMLTYAANWYRNLMKEAMLEKEKNNLSDKKAIYKVGLSFLNQLKKDSLMLNLELLSIRYTFLQLLDGCTLETTTKELRGGNINGTTIFKRIGWGEPSPYYS